MFETRKELFSKIEAQAAEIARLETELAAEQAKVSASINTDETVAGLNDDLNAAKAALADLEAKSLFEITELKASLAAAETKLATFDAQVEAAVLSKFAGLGGSPLEVATNEDPTSAETDMLAHYEKLEGQEKRDYLAKHAVKLQALAKAKASQA